MSYRTAVKRIISAWVAVLLLASTACAAFPPPFPPATSPPWPTLWLAKSGGTWEKGDDYGNYKILVFREIQAEHSGDRVLVQMTRIVLAKKKADSPTEEVISSFWLETPGIKGYIRDIHFQKVDGQRMALMLDIEMKAMDGVVLRELYVLHPDGTYKLLQPANGIDLYQ